MKNIAESKVTLVEEIKALRQRVAELEKQDAEHTRVVEEELRASNEELQAANEELQSEITERRRAEETLRESEERLSQIIQGSSIPTFVIDNKHIITHWNKACENLTGIPASEVIGTNKQWMAFYPEERAVMADLIVNDLPEEEITKYYGDRYQKSTVIEGACEAEDFFPHLGEKGKWLFFTAAPLIDVQGRILGAIETLHDITERKQAEHELNQRIKELLCLYSIVEIAETPGLTLDELYQEVVKLLPLSWQYPEVACARITINGKEFQTEYYRQTVWKQSSDIKVSGAKTGVVEVNYLAERPEAGEGPFSKEERLLINTVAEQLGKITERKQVEEKIKQAAEEWRTTFDSIADLLSIQDKDFRLTRVNKALADTFKMKPAELIGKTCYEVVHGTDGPMPNCPHVKTLETERSATEEFFEPRLGIYLEVTTSPIFNDMGEVVASVHVARDITERKQMQQQLILTDRLASIGELASGIAHELNNPLTSVIGFAQLLLDKDIPDDIKEDVRIISSEAQRAAGVVKNLLTFARKHAPVKQLVNVNEVIEKVLELRAYEQKVSNIRPDTRFAAELPEVMADYFQLQQVFLNIVINAEHFMIEAHNKGNLTIVTERVNNMVRISFMDDGPGVPPENLRHLFDPFFTTKEVGDGTGLGLSICHGIIAEHGGRIYVESEQGKGATFTVELPVSTNDREEE